MQVLGFSIMKLLQEDPRSDLWPDLQPNKDQSISELNVQFYTQKKNFIGRTDVSGRLKVIHNFLVETTKLRFDQEPPY